MGVLSGKHGGSIAMQHIYGIGTMRGLTGQLVTYTLWRYSIGTRRGVTNRDSAIWGLDRKTGSWLDCGWVLIGLGSG